MVQFAPSPACHHRPQPVQHRGSGTDRQRRQGAGHLGHLRPAAAGFAALRSLAGLRSFFGLICFFRFDLVYQAAGSLILADLAMTAFPSGRHSVAGEPAGGS